MQVTILNGRQQKLLLKTAKAQTGALNQSSGVGRKGEGKEVQKGGDI